MKLKSLSQLVRQDLFEFLVHAMNEVLELIHVTPSPVLIGRSLSARGCRQKVLPFWALVLDGLRICLRFGCL